MKKIDKSNKPMKILPGYSILPNKYTSRFLVDTLNAYGFNPIEEMIKTAKDEDEMGSVRLKATMKIADMFREDTKDENSEVVNFMIAIKKNYDKDEEDQKSA